MASPIPSPGVTAFQTMCFIGLESGVFVKWSQLNSNGDDEYICMEWTGLFISTYTKVSFENPEIREKSVIASFQRLYPENSMYPEETRGQQKK